MDNLYQSDIFYSSMDAILIALAKVQVEHGLCLQFQRTLERLGERTGVEDSATLPVRFFAHNESGQSVNEKKEKILTS
jgi:hypothetical protein